MKEEIIQLVDLEGNPTGSAPRSVCHSDNTLIQLVVHIEIFNDKGDIYLQKRSKTKDLYPGLWDTAVGGHVCAGENPYVAVMREAEEELGIKPDNPEFLFKYIHSNDTETEVAFLYKTVYNGPFNIDYDEVVDGRFYGITEIESLIGKNYFTDNFENEYSLLKKEGII
jgi:isopentenyldiphosphate isomerase